MKGSCASFSSMDGVGGISAGVGSEMVLSCLLIAGDGSPERSRDARVSGWALAEVVAVAGVCEDGNADSRRLLGREVSVCRAVRS